MENPDQFRERFRMQRPLNELIGVKIDGMSENKKHLQNPCRKGR